MGRVTPVRFCSDETALPSSPHLRGRMECGAFAVLSRNCTMNGAKNLNFFCTNNCAKPAKYLSYLLDTDADPVEKQASKCLNTKDLKRQLNRFNLPVESDRFSRHTLLGSLPPLRPSGLRTSANGIPRGGPQSGAEARPVLLHLAARAETRALPKSVRELASENSQTAAYESPHPS